MDGGVGSSPLRRTSPSSNGEVSAGSVEDPILPFLRSVAESLDDITKNPSDADWDSFKLLLEKCIEKFGQSEQYKNDKRLLKIWILYADAIQDFEKIYETLEEKGQFMKKSLLYEAYTIFLTSKGNLQEAYKICKLGISRNAEPIDNLKSMHEQLCKKCPGILGNHENLNTKNLEKPSSIDPWCKSTLTDLLQKIDQDMKKYSGFHRSNKAYAGKVSLTSLHNNSRNKIVELGHYKYQIKGCSGTGALAKVFKAFVDENPDEIVALKIQKPSYPWEFHMYRQLDKHISGTERLNFGNAHRMHIYSDISVLVCDYLSHGTLHDAINSHVVTNQHMDEVLCIYYTIQMLHMLEILHGNGILHGDFKPDNLLVRYPKEDLTEEMLRDQNGSWLNQGLCLVDWGRGIDLNLFPKNIKFIGDCRTSGFSCVEMKENREWKYQVDTYGLCVIVHMMLFGTYMSIEKKINSDGNYIYQPKSPLKRYWNGELWKNLFTTLLNNKSCEGDDVAVLKSLRESFERYLFSNIQLVSKLNQSLAKQKASLCSA
ncbi:hypothetical protein LUZ60_010803 [Juncus effusus]|nr:hypothetical protein LUZ60_010803 [Juncus effusus]